MVVQNPLDRVPGDVVAEIRERATDARVPPRWILDRHPHHEVGHLAWRYRPASTSAGAAVVLPGNQPPVPAENRVRRDDAGDLPQNPPAEFLASHRESTALGVGQAKWTWAKLLPEDPILLPEIIDHVFLVAVHPASGREYEEAQSVGHSLRLPGEQPLAPTLFRRFANLGRFVAPYAVKRILHDHRIAPAPERNPRTPWKTFLQAHGEDLAAADLFTVEVLTLAGLRRYFVFFVIELKTRRVHIAGIHPQPDARWMEQMARNLTDPVDGFLRTARQLIHDRDPLYTRVLGEILTSGDVGPIRLPPKSPNLNAYAERFVRSIKEECLYRVVPLGEGHVRLIVHEYVEHYHRERNHQGLDTQLLQRPPPPVRSDADVQRREGLGELLIFYYREAA